MLVQRGLLRKLSTGLAALPAGSAARNGTAISASIGGLNIASGAGFWLCWTDVNATGADDGLAVLRRRG